MSENVTVIDIVAQVTDETEAGADSATKRVNRLEQTMKKLQGEITKFGKMSKVEMTMYAIDKASSVMNGVWNTGKRLGGKVWNVTLKAVDLVTAPFRGIMRMIANPIVAAAGIAGIGLGVGDLVNTYKDFEQGMANVKAITRGTDADMAKLTETARELGASTAFSAQEVAGAMEYLAMAGWKTNSIIAGMPGLLDLAAAGAVDVATAADVVSSTLAQFNMEASEAGRVADILAATATSSKTDVAGLGESLKYAGPQAGALGYALEDVAIALGLMGTKGIDASTAGTTLRTTLARMAKQGELTGEETEAVAKSMNELGISLTDNEGKTKSFLQIMKDLRSGFSKLSETEKAATATNLAGMYAQSGLLAIVNASEKEFGDMVSVMEEYNGVSKEMAGTRMDTLAGAMEELSGAADDVKIAFVDRLAPHMKQFIEWLTGKMPWLTSAAIKFADGITQAIDRATAAIDDMTGSAAWQNADTFWEKAKVAWDQLIAEPFSEWWNGPGKAWASGAARDIGQGIGSAIKGGLMALFGIDAEGVMDEGLSIARSFSDGFSKGIEGLDWGKVAKGIGSALTAALGIAFSNPVTGAMASAWIGGKVLGGVSGAYNTAQGVKGMWTSLFGTGAKIAGSAVTSGGGLFGGISQGLAMANAAKTGGTAAQSALAFAQAGQLGLGAKIGAAGAGGMALGAAGIAGGVTTAIGLVDATTDLVRGFNAVDKREADAYKASAGAKYGGMVAGAALGTAILPGVGTLIGAGVGYLGGKFMGDAEIKRYEEEMRTAEEAAKRLFIQQEQAKYSSGKLQQAVQDWADGYITAEQLISQKQAVITENLKKRFGTIKLSMFEIQSIATKITFGDMKAGMDAFTEASARADNALSTLRETSSELERLNWKASIGIEYDTEEYRQGIDAFIANAKEYVESRQYEITTATKLLLGDMDMTGLNGAFSKIQEDIEGISQSLRLEFEVEGDLNTESILTLQNQLTEKLSVLSTAEYEGNLDMLKVRFGGDRLSLESFSQLQSELEGSAQIAQEALNKTYSAAFTGLELELAQGVFGPEGKNSQAYKDQFSALQTAFETESKGVSERITGFLTEEIGEKFGLSAEELTSGLQESLKAGVQPSEWNATQASEFLGLPSLEDKGVIELKEMAGRLTAMFPEIFGELIPTPRFGGGNTSGSFGSGRGGGFGGGRGSDSSSIGVDANISVTRSTIINGATLTPDQEKLTNAYGLTQEQLELAGAGGYYADANGGIFGAYADGGILDWRGLRPISDYTDSRGVMGSAHVGLVGEDGAEAIIPLSTKRRGRGLTLWEKAGEMLGVRSKRSSGVSRISDSIGEHASGGIFGKYADGSIMSAVPPAAMPLIPAAAGDSAGASVGGIVTVPVTIDNVTLEVNFDSDSITDTASIVQILKDNIRNLTDEIAHSIAVSLEQVFANLPKAATEG